MIDNVIDRSACMVETGTGRCIGVSVLGRIVAQVISPNPVSSEKRISQLKWRME